jgi:hypothetical protein
MASGHIGVGANKFQVAMSGEFLAVAMASEQIATGADEFPVAMSGGLLAAAMARSEQLVTGAVDEFLLAMSGELLVAAGDSLEVRVHERSERSVINHDLRYAREAPRGRARGKT